MKKVILRTVKEFDLDDVTGHLLLIGELKGDCFHCKEAGLDYVSVKSCPQCGCEFRYSASRQSALRGTKGLSMIKNRRPDLIFVELDDVLFYKNKEKAQGLFS